MPRSVSTLHYNGSYPLLQVSSGAVDMAKTNLKQMLIQCAKPLPEGATEDLAQAQKKSEYDVIHELVRQVTSPNTLVREQVRNVFYLFYSKFMLINSV